MGREGLRARLDAVEASWPQLMDVMLSPEERIDHAISLIHKGEARHADFELVLKPQTRHIREDLLDHSVEVLNAKGTPRSELAYELVTNQHPMCLAVQIVTTAPEHPIPGPTKEMFQLFLDWKPQNDKDLDGWAWAHCLLVVMGDLDALDLRREFVERTRPPD